MAAVGSTALRPLPSRKSLTSSRVLGSGFEENPALSTLEATCLLGAPWCGGQETEEPALVLGEDCQHTWTRMDPKQRGRKTPHQMDRLFASVALRGDSRAARRSNRWTWQEFGGHGPICRDLQPGSALPLALNSEVQSAPPNE
jgi:hypothetical protein